MNEPITQAPTGTTMILFKHGREVARQSGAMNAAGIESWVQQALR